MDNTNEFGTVKGMGEGLHVQREVLGDRNIAQFNTSLFSQHLPWHNVRMVLHFSQENGIALLQISSAPSMSHEVDGFRGAAGDDGFGSVEPLLEFGPTGFVALGCLTGERVNRSVNVGV